MRLVGVVVVGLGVWKNITVTGLGVGLKNDGRDGNLVVGFGVVCEKNGILVVGKSFFVVLVLCVGTWK